MITAELASLICFRDGDCCGVSIVTLFQWRIPQRHCLEALSFLSPARWFGLKDIYCFKETGQLRFIQIWCKYNTHCMYTHKNQFILQSDVEHKCNKNNVIKMYCILDFAAGSGRMTHWGRVICIPPLLSNWMAPRKKVKLSLGTHNKCTLRVVECLLRCVVLCVLYLWCVCGRAAAASGAVHLAFRWLVQPAVFFTGHALSEVQQDHADVVRVLPLGQRFHCI